MHYYWHFELYIEIARIFRYQDDVLTKNYVAAYLQACDTVMLVVRAAGKHKESHAETKITLIKKQSKHSIGFIQAMAMANLPHKTLVITQARQGTSW